MNLNKFKNKEPRFYDIISGLFIAVFLISEIGAVKIISFGSFQLPGATVIFPIAYIFGDILTEVYGYARARRTIWTGFVSAILMSLTFFVIQRLPSSPNWHNQQAFEVILGFVPRIVCASILAYFIGEFANSYVLAKMKVLTNGKMLWSRTIGSTIIGQALDSTVFGLFAFWGILPFSVLMTLIISLYVFKVFYEVVATPLTYVAIGYLKKKEEIDVYDNDTDFMPFRI